MNGEFLELYTKITADRKDQELKQEERHTENQTKFATLSTWVRCIVIAVGFLYSGLAAVLFLWIRSAIAG